MFTDKTFGVKDVIEGMEYEFRVLAINTSGAGEFSTPSEFVYARDPKSRLQSLVFYSFIILLLSNQLTSYDSLYGVSSKQLQMPVICIVTEPPGKVIDLKVTDSTYTTLSLSWTKPKDIEGVEDEAKGYFVEIRPAENPEWDRCNTNAIIMTSFTVKGLKSMAMYWGRVIATNDGGLGQPQELDNYILAMPPPGESSSPVVSHLITLREGNMNTGC